MDVFVLGSDFSSLEAFGKQAGLLFALTNERYTTARQECRNEGSKADFFYEERLYDRWCVRLFSSMCRIWVVSENYGFAR